MFTPFSLFLKYGVQFPYVVDSVITRQDSDSTSLTVNLPSFSAGDVVLLFCCPEEQATPELPTGWNVLSKGDGRARITTFMRRMEGGDGSTVGLSWSLSQNMVVFAYTLRNTSTTAGCVAAISKSNSVPNPPSLNPGWGAQNTLWFAGCARYQSNITITAYPSNYTGNQLTDITTGGTDNAGGAFATRELNASSEDPGTFTLSSNADNNAITLAVPPPEVTATAPSIAAVANGTDLLTADTSATVSLPSGSGGYILICAALSASTAMTATGWTAYANQTQRFLLREADGSEGSSVNVTFGGSVTARFRSLRITGAKDGVSFASTLRAASNGNSSSPTPPSVNTITVTTLHGPEPALYIVAARAVSAFTAYPSGYSDNQYTAGSSSDVSIAVATKQATVAGTESPGSFTTSASSAWRTATIVFYSTATPPGP